ncbi:hypothetical protein [Vulcanisaeta thermophila]|uniref:hypothetical protein n=1 Tax=Vulcanisaeta thermophila TaxID=867917 RepID=UPI00085320B6|nr:hypothetical protein [Vulcanisaeta thermophila]
MRLSEVLRKLGIEPISVESLQILAASLKVVLDYAGDLEELTEWVAPVLPSIVRLSASELRSVLSEAWGGVSIRECQFRVQKLIPPSVRKRFAAYYTTQEGLGLMASITREYLIRSGMERVVLADPFLGSALTLTTTIESVGPDRIGAVWGIEPLPLPALVAYAALLHAMKGRREAVNVILGDAFREVPRILTTQVSIPRPHVVLTNPPFTRWGSLERDYRAYVISTIEGLGYGRYITRGDASLQVMSILLIDSILRDGGLLITVLPASTFYTIYGRGLKELLRERYVVKAIIGNGSRPSFSEDSGFREVIMVAVKGHGEAPTAFIELNGEDTEGIARAILSGSTNHASFNLHTLPRLLDINWLALLGEDGLRDIVIDILEQGLKRGTLGYWGDMLGEDSIIRGIEMYGPEFFFIPNKHWEIIEERWDSVRIGNGRQELTISRNYLVRTLRKPSLYSHRIIADVNTYMLSIPPTEISELPVDLQVYIEWGVNSGTARPAMNAYGRYWYSHVHGQVMSKRPFGRVFIPDKVDLLFRNRGVFANYTNEEVAASKNFYIIKNINNTQAKLLIGWFNSTIFIATLALLGRRISRTWTRFLKNDYLELPMINIDTRNNEATAEVTKAVDKILNRHLPPLWKQLGEEYRYELDLAVARLIGIKNPGDTLEKLYKTLTTQITV